MKIGTDIVKIERLERSLQSEAFLRRVYAPAELEYCKRLESFAGLFAAKEAYLKALGTGITSADLTRIEICHDENGKPYLNGIANSDLSISHDGDYAVATVILW